MIAVAPAVVAAAAVLQSREVQQVAQQAALEWALAWRPVPQQAVQRVPMPAAMAMAKVPEAKTQQAQQLPAHWTQTCWCSWPRCRQSPFPDADAEGSALPDPDFDFGSAYAPELDAKSRRWTPGFVALHPHAFAAFPESDLQIRPNQSPDCANNAALLEPVNSKEKRFRRRLNDAIDIMAHPVKKELCKGPCLGTMIPPISVCDDVLTRMPKRFKAD